MNATSPVNPRAKTIRTTLKAAGLADHVRKVTSGNKRTYVRLEYAVNGGDVAANAIADALRPLWTDGAQRVRVLYGGLIIIERDGWYRTHPDTPEGRAARAAAEDDRTAGLLAAGTEWSNREHGSVRYQPDEAHPREPWVDRSDRRWSSLDVYPVVTR